MALPLEVTPTELDQWLRRGDRLHLVDVRYEEEFELCRLEGAVLLPLPELAERSEELRALADLPVILYCHHGVRSLKAAFFARSLGLDAASLAGGIDRWSLQIDPKIPRY